MKRTSDTRLDDDDVEAELSPCATRGRSAKKMRPTMSRSPSSYLKRFKCSFGGCDKAYTKPSKLADHERSHTGERPFCCSEPGCSKRFLRKSHLQAHAKFHLPKDERPYICEEVDCGKRFSTNQHLRQHRSLHFEPKPYTCTECDQSFHKHYQLKRHVADTHLFTKPCPCPVAGCDMSFAYESILKKHISRTHNTEDRYACDIDNCGVRFSKWSALQGHIKESHKLRCEYCSKAYTDTTAFKLHLETHEIPLSERQRFICPAPECEKRFTKAHALKRHISFVHEGVREHACHLCPAVFAHRRTLVQHLERHATPVKDEVIKSRSRPTVSMLERLTGVAYATDGRRRIRCPVETCRHAFSRAYDLDRHMRAAHPSSPPRTGDDAIVSPEIMV